jgi:hypothetical protein
VNQLLTLGASTYGGLRVNAVYDAARVPKSSMNDLYADVDATEAFDYVVGSDSGK